MARTRREFPSLFSAEETARRVGNYRWAELHAYGIMGGWITNTSELEVKSHLGNYCYHHAFHAELWEKRLPELRGVGRQSLTASPNLEFEAFMAALEGSVVGDEGQDTTIEGLTGLYRVFLPGVIATNSYHLENSSTISDAPTMRILELCLNDEMDEWRQGERLLQSLMIDDVCIERSTIHQAKLAKLLLASGGVAGPGSAG